jgi:hypothetical protein
LWALGVLYVPARKVNEAQEQFQRSANLAPYSVTAFHNLFMFAITW